MVWAIAVETEANMEIDLLWLEPARQEKNRRTPRSEHRVRFHLQSNDRIPAARHQFRLTRRQIVRAVRRENAGNISNLPRIMSLEPAD